MSPSLEGIAFCIRCLVGSRSSITSGHKSQAFQSCSCVVCMCPPHCGVAVTTASLLGGGLASGPATIAAYALAGCKAWPWLLQAHWWAGLAPGLAGCEAEPGLLKVCWWVQVVSSPAGSKTAVGCPGNLEEGCQNGTHEYMYQHRISYKKMVVSVSIPRREAQLPPASPAGSPRLGSGSPLPMVNMLFKVLFLHCFLG